MSKNLPEIKLQELLTKLTESQIIANNQMTGLDMRVKQVEETLVKRVYLSAVEAQAVKKHVKSKVSELCRKNNWEYETAYRILIQALYGETNDQYNVTSYRELPSTYFSEIIEKIDKWIPTTTIIDRINNKAA